MALRIVVDTNVFVSVFQFGGRIGGVLDLALQGAVEICVSQPIVDELSGVLRQKFHWSAERAGAAAETLLQFCRLVDPHEALKVCRDPDDDRVLECALAASAEVIVSGDRDLLVLGAFRGTPIMSPRLFLDSVLWKR
jgi:putative PIN family toxin of toxin-antitoxin system